MAEPAPVAIAPPPAPALEVRDLSKRYRSGDHEVVALREVTFTLPAAATCAIVGPSGSGKTTLLGLCAGLDRASGGSVRLAGVLLDSLDEDARARVRNEHTGFVFQNFQLVPTLTAIENVMVPAELRPRRPGRPRDPAAVGREVVPAPAATTRQVRAEAAALLGRVGLAARLEHYPAQLSGGEQQRVALARAFVNRPRILFADEPTGNLDAETSERIVELLFELNAQAGTALVLVTHNAELAARTGRVIPLRDGRMVEPAPAVPR